MNNLRITVALLLRITLFLQDSHRLRKTFDG